jgi:hypothetical protein
MDDVKRCQLVAAFSQVMDMCVRRGDDREARRCQRFIDDIAREGDRYLDIVHEHIVPVLTQEGFEWHHDVKMFFVRWQGRTTRGG